MKRLSNGSISAWALSTVLASWAQVAAAQPAPRPAQPAPAPIRPAPPAAGAPAPVAPGPAPAPAPGPVAQPAPAAPVPAPAVPPAVVQPAPATPPPVAPTDPAPSAPSSSPETPAATVIPPANEPPPAAPPPSVPSVAEPPPAAPPPPVAESAAWYEGLAFSAFVDAYGAVDFNFPKSPGQSRSNPVRAFDNHNGFALNWVGLDVQKDPAPVGGTLSLRFGPGAQRLASACVDADTCDSESSLGLSYVKQAFVSWKPLDALTLDLGKFDTPYGAEVADSQYNINYTRGALYWLGQPAYHTGLRVGIDAARSFNLKLLAVNGWNRTIDNNSGKTFGLQGTYRLPKAEGSDEDLLTVAVGYLVGPEHGDTQTLVCPAGQRFDPTRGCVLSQASEGGSGVADLGSSNTKGLRHFLDLTAVATPIPELKLLLNASLGIDRARDPGDITKFRSATWWGVMAGARYAVNEHFGVAGRIEHYADPDGYTTGFAEDVVVRTGTLTLDYIPAEHMVVFLDGRADWSSKQIFPKAVHEEERAASAVSVTLGAVVSTN
ncbi:MAG TPA: porin [Polyangiaceae bacterium]|nr:porin [Polyangiaceae bacterium]